MEKNHPFAQPNCENKSLSQIIRFQVNTSFGDFLTMITNFSKVSPGKWIRMSLTGSLDKKIINKKIYWQLEVSPDEKTKN